MSWIAMSWPTAGFLSVLLVVNIAFLVGWLRARRTHPLRDKPTAGDAVIGFVTDFFDALGIGSFAPTTALFKLRGRPADELVDAASTPSLSCRPFGPEFAGVVIEFSFANVTTVRTTRISAAASVQPTSSRVLPWICAATRPLRARNLNSE